MAELFLALRSIVHSFYLKSLFSNFSFLAYREELHRPGWFLPIVSCALETTPSSALPSQSGTGWFCHLGRGFHCLSCRLPECRSHNRPPGAPEEPSRYLQRYPKQVMSCLNSSHNNMLLHTLIQPADRGVLCRQVGPCYRCVWCEWRNLK